MARELVGASQKKCFMEWGHPVQSVRLRQTVVQLDSPVAPYTSDHPYITLEYLSIYSDPSIMTA